MSDRLEKYVDFIEQAAANLSPAAVRNLDEATESWREMAAVFGFDLTDEADAEAVFRALGLAHGWFTAYAAVLAETHDEPEVGAAFDQMATLALRQIGIMVRELWHSARDRAAGGSVEDLEALWQH